VQLPCISIDPLKKKKTTFDQLGVVRRFQGPIKVEWERGQERGSPDKLHGGPVGTLIVKKRRTEKELFKCQGQKVGD